MDDDERDRIPAEHIVCPDDFDIDDVGYAKTLVPEGAFVRQMITVVSWYDPVTDRNRWRCYNATGEGETLLMCIGLLDLAKLDLIARSDCGIPLQYPDDD